MLSGPFEALHVFREELEHCIQGGIRDGVFEIETIQASNSGMQPSPAALPALSNSEASGVTSPHSNPTSSTDQESGSGQSFSKMSPDVLALLQKLPEGDIPGVQYDLRASTIHIKCQAPEDQEDRITRFQAAYQGIITSPSFKVEAFKLPPTVNSAQAAALVSRFNDQYTQSVFAYIQGRSEIRVVSKSSRQFDQAKRLLLQNIQPTTSETSTSLPVIAPSAGPHPSCMVMHLPHNRKLTLKKANIITEDADVIVNAANSRLLHGGGIAGAIDKALTWESGARSQKRCQNNAILW